MTLRAGSSSRHFGPTVLGVLVAGLAGLWWVARPAAQPVGSYVGQLLGAEAVLLMTFAMVLISTLPWVETWFDGIDRAAVWHRRAALTGVLLVVPHLLTAHGGRGPGWSAPAGVVSAGGLGVLVVWAVLPRWRSVLPAPARSVVFALRDFAPARALGALLGNYEYWRALHRLTGLFLAVGFVHGLTDATPFADAPVLRWTYLVVGGTGLVFYAWRELLARRGHGLRDYQVHRVTRKAPDLTEIELAPLGRPLRFAPGQFAMIHIEAKDGWHRHPFTLTGSPGDEHLRITVKALGDYTRSLPGLIAPGMPAVVSGPHGRFVQTKATERQVWIAGGVGITPFLSWLRSLDRAPVPGEVHLFYSASASPDGGIAYADEIEALAAGRPGITVHVVDPRVAGRLTVATVLEPWNGRTEGLSVFLCGPEAMVRELQAGLRSRGVPARRIHREHFDWR